MHSLKSRLIYHILNSRDNYQNTSNIINPPLHVYDPLERQGPCEVFYKIKKDQEDQDPPSNAASTDKKQWMAVKNTNCDFKI